VSKKYYISEEPIIIRKPLINHYLFITWLILFVIISALIIKVVNAETEAIDLRKRGEELQQKGEELQREAIDLRKRGEELQQKNELKQKSNTISKRMKDDKGNVFDTYVVDIKTANMKFYFKDSDGIRIASLQKLKQYIELNSNELVFATNGGMYTSEGSPLGLLIIDGQRISPLNLGDDKGNFYLKPNGVFAITHEKAFITNTQMFNKLTDLQSILFATQSGPLLVMDGKIHPKFDMNSKNKHIRSGVGIISPRRVVFAISDNTVTFFDFATLFKDKFGCKDALYLDGVVSRMYLPELKRYDLDGGFASIIAVTKNASKLIK